MPTGGAVEVLSGVFLIIGRYVIVALTAMIPSVLGILGFHHSDDVEGIIPGLVVGSMLQNLNFSTAIFIKRCF